MKQKIVRRASALVLAGCLLAGAALPALAASAKEEVIYANLDASGTVTGVYAVNSFAVQADPGVLRAGDGALPCRRGTPSPTMAATPPCAT